MTRESDGPDGPTLARWEAGVGGTDWLRDLAADAKATDLGGNDYPCKYAIPAGTFLSVLKDGFRSLTGP